MNLKERWNALLNEQPGLRIRNAATALGVSEAELLATHCGETVTRLRPEFKTILGEISSLGFVMALTRNDHVVHERKGVYNKPSFQNASTRGVIVGEDIDLRIFLDSWDSVFAVEEGSGEDLRRSIQFFAKNGEAVHKIYMTQKSDMGAYNRLAERFTSENQTQSQRVVPLVDARTETPDEEIDVAGFQDAWRNLQDTHDFFGLLWKFNLTRVQALRLAPEGNYAVPVHISSYRSVFQKAAEQALPIMVFVGNQGMLQIHSGPIFKLVRQDGWYNILDPLFNLHLREESVAQSWAVRKPTVDGTVTALEYYDKDKRLICQLFGKRKPGIPELEQWATLVRDIEKEHALATA